MRRPVARWKKESGSPRPPSVPAPLHGAGYTLICKEISSEDPMPVTHIVPPGGSSSGEVSLRDGRLRATVRE